VAAPVQTNSADDTASGLTLGVAQTSSPTNGNTNIVWVLSQDGSTVTVTDDQGHTYTPRGSVTEAAIPYKLVQFTAPITSSGANTVTAAFSPASDFRGIAVVEAQGAYDAANTGTDTGNNPTDTVSATNTAQPATVYMLGDDLQSGTALGVGTGFTNIGTGWPGSGPYRLQYKEVTATGSQSGNFANATNSRNLVGMVICVDGGGGAPATSLTFPRRMARMSSHFR
jgi:hypothetical protein